MNSSRVPLLCSLLIALCSAAAFGQGSPGRSPSPTPTPTPSVNLVGSNDGAGLKFSVTLADVRLLIPIELDHGSVTGFTASVDDFSGPRNSVVPATVTLDGKPANAGAVISQKDRPRLVISATLPADGEYKSRIVLFYNDKRAPSVPLTVTRARNDASVQIEAIEAGRATRGFSSADAKVRFNVHETRGQAIGLYAPVLFNFALKESDKTQKQARYDRMELKLPAAATTPEPTPSLASRTPAATFLIDPLGTREVVMTIAGIRDPGEYTGIIRLSSADTAPVEKTFTVFVKDSWIYAFFCIFLGVAASYLIRRYTKETRPRLEAQVRVSDLRGGIDEEEAGTVSPGETERRVISVLRKRLDKADRDLRLGKKDTATVLDEMEKKIQALHDWLVVGRRLAAVVPPDPVKTLRHDWEDLADTYFLKTAPTEDPATKLKEICKKADEAVTAFLTGRIDDFAKVADTYKTAHPARAQEIESEIKPLLEAAKTDVKALKFPDASEKLKSARAAYAHVLAEELDDALQRPAPPGFTPGEWQKLGEDLHDQAANIKKESDPDNALRLYHSVNQRYLMAILSALDGEIKRTQKDIEDSALPDKDKNDKKAQLGIAQKNLDLASRLVKSGSEDEALASYKSASDIVTAVQAPPPAGVKSIAGGEIVDFAPFIGKPPSGADVPADIARPEIPPLSNAEKIVVLLDRYDLLLNAGLLLIATLLGMKLLWADDPIWGGWKSYVIAFLWGLGLQQIAGTAYEGLPAITKKLTE